MIILLIFASVMSQCHSAKIARILLIIRINITKYNGQKSCVVNNGMFYVCLLLHE